MHDALRLSVITLIAGLGGMVNSIAGGGTLLTFPSIVALGVPPLVANATSTVALWPGALSSMLGYREHLRGLRRWSTIFAIPSVIGGIIGAWLLLVTPEQRFTLIVPWLVIGATVLFAVQGPIMRRLRAPAPGALTRDDGEFAPRHGATALAFQFLVGVYGGYFGAGIGILMLAVLGFMGFTDIHRMNGLKNWGGLCMNFVAAAMFTGSGIVDWKVALAMAVGSAAGGYLASRLAQRVPQRVVRRAIIAVGFTAGTWLLWMRLAA
jgi:uncharacterized membrane protein YfcA